MKWTGESYKELERMLRGGATYQQMAEFFGCSRNSVLGKADRLGLSKFYSGDRRFAPKLARDTPAKEAARRIAVRPRSLDAEGQHPRRKPAAPNTLPPAPPAAARAAARRAFVAETLDGVGKDMLALREGDCRWPLGSYAERATTFCAQPRVLGAYCGDHARIAYSGKS